MWNQENFKLIATQDNYGVILIQKQNQGLTTCDNLTEYDNIHQDNLKPLRYKDIMSREDLMGNENDAHSDIFESTLSLEKELLKNTVDKGSLDTVNVYW